MSESGVRWKERGAARLRGRDSSIVRSVPGITGDRKVSQLSLDFMLLLGSEGGRDLGMTVARFGKRDCGT